MLDIALLLSPLTPAENPGLDTLDPRFQEIAGLVEAGEFLKASEQTQNLLKDGIVDIRIVSYFLYGVFLETGLPGLPKLFEALVGLFGQNWPACGPAQKKEKHAENGVGWFLNRLTKKLKAEEEAKSDEFSKWLEQVPADAVPPIIAKIGEVRTAMAVANSLKLADAIKAVEDWVNAYEKMVQAAKPPEPEKTKEDEAAPPESAALQTAARGASSARPGDDRFLVEGSMHLQELSRKILAFEALIKKKQFGRASVVYNDIATIVEHFDPRVYIPKMFGTFYALSVQNLDSLLPDLEKRESPGWKAMEQLYRVDVETFSK